MEHKMTQETPLLLPTTVIGSHATPSWLWTSIAEIEKGNYGETDIKETFDDAVMIAITDQERAGIDIITDGEMRRWYFVQSFYRRMENLIERPPLRKVGVYGYDSPKRYIATDKVSIPDGLGITEEYLFSKNLTDKPLKVTCPGPLTLTMHIQPGKAYKNRLDLAWEFAEVINKELKALVELGAEFIQIDEPSFAIIPGELQEWVDLYNSTVQGVTSKLALHVCFGNLGSRPRGKRNYDWMFPELLKTRSDQLILEFSNREMNESDLWGKVGDDRELCAGVIDIKSFYVETPEDVANRIRQILKVIEPDKLQISPDCGFFQLPRWLTCLKLDAMVKGTNLVRKELI